MGKLSDTACRAAKATDRPLKLSDGEGLRLWVSVAGKKTWRLAFRYGGQACEMGFGDYPAVSLAAARRLRDEARAQLADGIDPRNPDAPPPPAGPTFKEVAVRWLDKQTPNWVPKHAGIVTGRLETEVFPRFGSKVARTVDRADVLAALDPIEARGALVVARKLRQTLDQIFVFAVAAGDADSNPAALVKGALAPAPRARNHTKVRDLVDFMRRLHAYDGDPLTPMAIEMVLRTAVRTSELRFATEGEVEGDVWRIPAERMKENREHLVPLAPGALRLLDRAAKLRGESSLLFPGERGPMSENTMLYALYRMGLKSRATMHGLRGVFSTAANEAGWNGDWIEMQLAHVEGGVRGAYNAALYLAQRRELMLWWDGVIDDAKTLS